MKRITLIRVVVSLLLTSGACLIAMRAACPKHGPIGRTEELVERLDSTYCEEHIFPMVVRTTEEHRFSTHTAGKARSPWETPFVAAASSGLNWA